MQGFKNILGLGNASPRVYDFDGKLVREEKLLSEGAFAFVWSARDLRTNETFALKKILCQETERYELATREVSFLQTIPSHPNLIKFHGSIMTTSNKDKEVVILMELCDGGHLLDLLDKYKGSLDESMIVRIFTQLLSGLSHMHSLDPPIAHRDLKVENILVLPNGNIKICDFGSCSTHFINTLTCSREDLLREKESIERYTTMIYRAPEMIDLHRKYSINEKVDVWMVGCILFTMMFYRHPFQDEGPLAIANAKYDIPTKHSFNKKLTDLLLWMLTVEPHQRPSAQELLKVFSDYHSLKSIPLPEAIALRCEQYYQRRIADTTILTKPVSLTETIKLPKKSKRPTTIRNTAISMKKNNFPFAESFDGDNKGFRNLSQRSNTEATPIWDHFNPGANFLDTLSNSNEGWANFDETSDVSFSMESPENVDDWQAFGPSSKSNAFSLDEDPSFAISPTNAMSPPEVAASNQLLPFDTSSAALSGALFSSFTDNALSTAVAPLSTAVAPLSTAVAPLSTAVAPLSTAVASLSTAVAPLSTADAAGCALSLENLELNWNASPSTTVTQNTGNTLLLISANTGSPLQEQPSSAAAKFSVPIVSDTSSTSQTGTRSIILPTPVTLESSTASPPTKESADPFSYFGFDSENSILKIVEMAVSNHLPNGSNDISPANSKPDAQHDGVSFTHPSS